MMPFTIRKLTAHDANQALELAYKAAYEHGFVNTEFNKSTFNFKVKSVFVQPNSESFGLFNDHELIGFASVLYDFLPWNDHKRMIIDFFHISPEHRNPTTYQYMMDHLRSVALQDDIMHIRTVGKNFTLNSFEKDGLLKANGFFPVDVIYEETLND